MVFDWSFRGVRKLSRVGSKWGLVKNLFHGLVSCTRDIAKMDLENRFPCSKFGALCASERERG